MINSQFYYHMNNECYKAYTHIKKLKKCQVKTLTEQVYQWMYLFYFRTNEN